MTFKTFLRNTGKGLFAFGKGVVHGVQFGLKVAKSIPVVGSLVSKAQHEATALLGSYLGGKVDRYLGD